MDTRTQEETPETNAAMNMLQIEDLINRQLVDIDKKKDEVKILKSTFEDAFKNDAKFRELNEKVKDATRVRNTYKQAMMKDPAINQAGVQFKNGQDELKDMQLALSDYAKEFKRVTGMTQFEAADGQLLLIKEFYKLARK